MTRKMKERRAEEIALKLNDTKRWHAHSRRISMQTLQNEIGLRIKDMDASQELGKLVKELHTFIVDYMVTAQILLLVRIAHPEEVHE